MDEFSTVLSKPGLTFEEAVTYFKGKIPVTAEQFFSLSQEYQGIAFTVSGYSKVQVVKKFHDELLRAIEDGETMRSFRDRMNDFLSDQGYKGVSPFQADNIFRTNVQTAYQVGHYQQMTDPTVLRLRPYWQYNAVLDNQTRAEHRAMNGRVYPADDPIWETWYPPNGFKCRCNVTSLSKRQVEQRGLTVEHEPPRGERLPDGSFANIMPDPNFDVNPAKVSFSPDLEGYPQSLVNAYKRMEKGK